MEPTSMGEFEQWCEALYTGCNPDVRAQAHQWFTTFQQQPDVASRCRDLLTETTSPYVQMLCVSTLTMVVEKPLSVFTPAERLQLRNFSLDFLYNKPQLESYVALEFCKLIARITKIGWIQLDKEEQGRTRAVTQDVAKFLESSSAMHYIIGVQILVHLVTQMNMGSIRSVSKQRKIASSFRDDSLHDIAVLSCKLTKKVFCNELSFGNPGQEMALLMQLLQLTHACFGFDFIGTSSDDAADELKTVQVPTTWRSLILEHSLVDMYFRVYAETEPPISCHALRVLVQLTSMRRTLFSPDMKARYLSIILHGVVNVMRTNQGLKSSENYHQFCRLLARLKTNYQLAELIEVDVYEEFITALTQLTVVSFQNWQWAPNSMHYLLNLWERLIASIPYMKPQTAASHMSTSMHDQFKAQPKTHMLEKFTPEIVTAFLNSRIASVEQVVAGNIEDMLEDRVALETQLKQFSTIVRCRYDQAAKTIQDMFDPLMQLYAELSMQIASLDAAGRMRLRVVEGRLTWLVNVIAHAVNSRFTPIHPSPPDEVNGNLIYRVLQLMRMLDERLQVSQPDSEQLHVAILTFLQHFRMTHSGDNCQLSVAVLGILEKTLGIQNDTQILDLFVTKIFTNLKWISSEEVIEQTLALFTELCMGYCSSRKLSELDSMKFILRNHGPDNFPFLQALSNTRLRTIFYKAVGRIMTLTSQADDFHLFMEPFIAVLLTLNQNLSSGQHDDLTKHLALGFVRDMRGIIEACQASLTCEMVFDFMYPDYTPIIVRIIEIWWNDPKIAVPALKLMVAFATNYNQRLKFCVSSSKGILLFREISKTIVAYGHRISSLTNIDESNLYPQKYKGIATIFVLLKASLTGEYVNFGVFELYGDDALRNALSMFFQLFRSLPLQDIINFPKLGSAFYSVLICVLREHTASLARLDEDIFRYLMMALFEGIKTVGSTINTHALGGADYIYSFVINARSKRKVSPVAVKLQQLCEASSQVSSAMMSYMLNGLVHEDCRSQWSTSRTLMSLILMYPQHFQAERDQMVAAMPEHRRDYVRQAFDDLMSGIEDNLKPPNRDTFTQHIAVFRRQMSNFPVPQHNASHI